MSLVYRYIYYVYINIHEFSILKNVLYTGILRSTVSGLGSFFNLINTAFRPVCNLKL